MRKDFWYPSCGAGRIHGCRWEPEGQPKAIVQIVHGITEYVERYDAFAQYLASWGFLVVAEDHMGHGKSVNGPGIEGYFHGGWFSAVEDTYRLLQDIRKEYPNTPCFLLGHSMGSFLARNILYLYPDSGISGAILSGTTWQPAAAMPAIVKIMENACRIVGEKNISRQLQNLVFGAYNLRVEHPRTALDWICRDNRIVDTHPMMQGHQPTAGLLRDMMIGVCSIEKKSNLVKMNRMVPVLFLAGGDDPVGGFGKGVNTCAEAFRSVGIQNVTVKIYPLCRHEILNEINKEEVFRDIKRWIENKI